MPQVRSLVIAFLIISTLVTGLTDPMAAQSPVPDGCSLSSPAFIQNGLDRIFFGACDRHDLCYETRNPASGPCFGFGTKASCDLNFFLEMQGACTLYASILAFPIFGFSEAEDFLQGCSAVAGLFFTAVALGGDFYFMRNQCDFGCNRDMCPGGLLPTYCPSPGCGTPHSGGEEPCVAILTETGTWILGPNGEATPAPRQLAFPLSRKEKRHGELSI